MSGSWHSVWALAAGLVLELAVGGWARAHGGHTAPQTSSALDNRALWRASMSRTPLPDRGCFEASYPDVAWKEIPCVAAPMRQYAPKSSIKTARNRDPDWVAAASGLIDQANGSFSTSGLKKEKQCQAGVCRSNVYSIQLNSGYFHTSVCADYGGCWQQFLYSSGDGKAFMQYWLLDGNGCPKGWQEGRYGAGNGCWKNSHAVKVPSFTISELDSTAMQASASGGQLSISFLANGTYYAVSDDDVLDLASQWHVVEYNIFGDSGSSRAKFNRGTTITVNLTLAGASDTQCETPFGYGAETNDLTLGNSCYMDGDYISYQESR